jgi:hypothetical protein
LLHLDLALLNLEIIGDGQVDTLFDGQVFCTILAIAFKEKSGTK